jgi:hypothetical protein
MCREEARTDPFNFLLFSIVSDFVTQTDNRESAFRPGRFAQSEAGGIGCTSLGERWRVARQQQFQS